MAKPTEKSPNNTSFFGEHIQTTPNKLMKLFPDSYVFENSGEDKTNIEFTLETDDGDVFTIYDWKYYRPLSMNETVDFHIGGLSENVTRTAKQELIKMLK